MNSGAVTASSTADTFTYTGTDLVNGNIVSFGGTMPGGITSGRLYFIVNVNTTAKTYQVSNTAGGSAIDLTSNGSGITNTARYALTIGSSGIDLGSATQSLASLSAPVSLSDNQTWTTTTFRAIDANNNANNSGVNILNNGYTLTVDTGGGRVDLGNIYGGGIKKNGAGTVNLYGTASGFTGNFEINAGPVTVSQDANALGSGASTLTMAGGTLAPRSNGNTNYGRNTVVIGNAGFYNNNSTNTASMAYTFGTLSIGAFTYSVTANGTSTGSLTYGATTLTGNATFDVGSRDNNFLVLGAVGESGGSRGFTKTGVGTLTITGSSTYTGTTTITGGSLKLDTNGSFTTSTKIVVGSPGSSGASLDLTAKTGTFTFGAGQTVGGIGTITIGDGKTVQSQGIWAPGNSIGSNAVTGNLTLSGTSQFELGTPGTSDFTAVSGTTSLGAQTVSMVGTVLDPAKASFLSGTSATTSLLLDFGFVNQNASVSPLGFNLWNLMQTNGYTADLALLSIGSGTGNSGAITTTLTSLFNNLASGTFNAYTASLDTNTAGSFTNIYTLSFKSANGGSVFTGDTTQTLTLTVQGTVVAVVPEPGAIALAGIGIAAAAGGLRRRRRAALVKG